MKMLEWSQRKEKELEQREVLKKARKKWKRYKIKKKGTCRR